MLVGALQLFTGGSSLEYPSPLHAALLRSLDSIRFTVDNLEALFVQEALDGIGSMALQAITQAADEEPSESICGYFMRSTQCVTNCEFSIPILSTICLNTCSSVS